MDAAERADGAARVGVQALASARLRRYVDQLLAHVLQQAETTVAAILTGLPRVQQESGLPGRGAADEAALAALPDAALRALCRAQQADNASLEAYVDQVAGVS